MGKFAISCPKCGKYVMAHNGLVGLIKNTVTCTCGTEIDVKAERMAATVCSQCGNTVVYDQGNSKKRKCPVCNNPIAIGEDLHMVSFRCPECNLELSAQKGADTYTCPVCDHVIDVTKAVEKKRLSDEGLISNIRYEGDNETLVFKHPIEDFRCGSQLTVHSSQEAVFFRDGEALDVMKEGRYALETQNLPIMDKLYKLPTDSTTPFHAEVYFVNMTTQMGIKWGTSEKARFMDPLTGAPLSVGARGVLNYKVSNSKKLLLKVVGTTAGLKRRDILGTGQSYFNDYFRPAIQANVSTFLAEIIETEKIDILRIDSQRTILAERLREALAPIFEEYGLSVTEFLVEALVPPTSGEYGYDTYKTLVELRKKGLTEKTIQTETDIRKVQQTAKKELDIQQQQNQVEVETARRQKIVAEKETALQEAKMNAQIKLAEEAGSVEAQRMHDQVELDRKAREAQIEADEMRAKGYTQKDVIQGEVMKAFAENPGEGGGSVRGAYTGAMQMGTDLAAMGAAANIAGNVMGQGIQAGQQIGSTIANGGGNTWTCTCGQNNDAQSKYCRNCGKDRSVVLGTWLCPKCKKERTGAFCPDCGAQRPEQILPWDCTCGQRNTGAFCTACGSPRPAMAEEWTCPRCGQRHLTGSFCPNCATKRPTAEGTWNCKCGAKNLTTKCCPECGEKKPVSNTATWSCSCGATGLTSKCCPECGNKRPSASDTWDCRCGESGITSKCCPECGTRRPEE